MITWSKPKLCTKYKGILFLKEWWSRVKGEPLEMLLDFGGDTTSQDSNKDAIYLFVVSVLA